MIYVTGDTWEKFVDFNDNVFDLLKEGDRLIFNGYVGLLKENTPDERAFIQKLAENPYQLLFVDSPRERLEYLMEYPVEDWCGGKVHVLACDERGEPKVIHLIRGQVFEIDGKIIFVHGGAAACDENVRGSRLWPNSRPNAEEEERIKEKLSAVGYKIDYIITYTAPEGTMMKMYPENMDLSCMSYYLEWLCENVTYKHWYFSSIWVDLCFGREQTCLCMAVKNIETNELLGWRSWDEKTETNFEFTGA